MKREDDDIVIISACRTPFGRFGGALKDYPIIDLGGAVLKELVKRVGIDFNGIDEMHMGLCTTAVNKLGIAGPVISRQCLIKAGAPYTIPSTTIDMACCASMAAVHFCCNALRLGKEATISLGAELMSQIPHVCYDARWGNRLGPINLKDSLFEMGYPGFNPVSVDTGEYSLELGISREMQDEWAYTSQQRYAKAKAQGKYKVGEELMSLEVIRGKERFIFEEDEFPRPETTLESLAKLKTIYGSKTVTAGNAPGLNDGASAVLMMKRKKAKEMGLTALGTIIATGFVSDEPRKMSEAPANIISHLLKEIGIDLKQINLIQINEAFAAMPLVSAKKMAQGDNSKRKEILEKTNVNGDAIAIGHPTGASGNRILMTLVYELRRRGGGLGACALCGGLNQGAGAIIKVE